MARGTDQIHDQVLCSMHFPLLLQLDVLMWMAISMVVCDVTIRPRYVGSGDERSDREFKEGAAAAHEFCKGELLKWVKRTHPMEGTVVIQCPALIWVTIALCVRAYLFAHDPKQMFRFHKGEHECQGHPPITLVFNVENPNDRVKETLWLCYDHMTSLLPGLKPMFEETEENYVIGGAIANIHEDNLLDNPKGSA